MKRKPSYDEYMASLMVSELTGVSVLLDHLYMANPGREWWQFWKPKLVSRPVSSDKLSIPPLNKI
jgi:hypothetical protein